MERAAKRSVRDWLLDGMTLLVALVALGVAGQRFLLPMLTGANSGTTPASAQVEKDLIGHAPGPMALVAEEAGEERMVDFVQSTPQLVVLFRSSCPACQATKAVWESIAAELPAGQQVHAVTADPPGGGGTLFTSDRVDVWHAARAAEYVEAYPTPYVPTTLVLGADGKIRYAHIGVLSDTEADSLRVLLRVQ